MILGVIKLKLTNLAASDITIPFKDKLQLGLFRTKAENIWDKLSMKIDSVNLEGIGGKTLARIEIPSDQKSEEAKERIKKFDTTRVRLCFQVSLEVQHLVKFVFKYIALIDYVFLQNYICFYYTGIP